METTAKRPHGASLLLLLTFTHVSAWGATPSQVGDVVVDRPTVNVLGFSVPMAGDDDYDAVATVSYRATLPSSQWRSALPLLRVRPETTSAEDPPEGYGLSRPGEQFAGSIFGLSAGTQYEVRIAVSDPDGGERSQTVVVRTRDVPRANPASPRVVNVSSASQLQSALNSAMPGDVVTLADGAYRGGFDVINRAGTAENPIIVRGNGATTVIDASGEAAGISVNSSSHVYVENLRIAGVEGQTNYGVSLSNGTGLVARNLLIEGDNGIDASFGANFDFYICDNDLRGPNVWPQLAVGNNEVIKGLIAVAVSGRGHIVCHNAARGFGSSLFVRMNGASMDNIAIDFHNNDVSVSADDGIELDGSMRNVRAWENRITNALMGISFQPVWGGPVYAIRNVVYNAASAPFKLNNDPSGVVLLHNTAFRYRETDIFGPYDGTGWPQLGEPANYAANTWIANNIIVGSDAPLFIRQEMPLLRMDHNGYWPSGNFRLQTNNVLNTYANLAAFSSGTRLEANGTTLTQPIFQNPPPAAADYKPLAPALTFALSSQSNALDRAAVLANVNDGFVGAAPDLGALELGQAPVVYGPRTTAAEDSSPMPPGNLSVQ